MSDTKKMSCFCGCQTFTVHVRTFGGNYKHHVSFRCEGCQCLRQITSPGYSADYVISPPLLSEPPARATLPGPLAQHSDGKVDFVPEPTETGKVPTGRDTRFDDRD